MGWQQGIRSPNQTITGQIAFDGAAHDVIPVTSQTERIRVWGGYIAWSGVNTGGAASHLINPQMLGIVDGGPFKILTAPYWAPSAPDSYFWQSLASLPAEGVPLDLGTQIQCQIEFSVTGDNGKIMFCFSWTIEDMI